MEKGVLKVVEKPLKTIPSNPYLDGVGLVNVEKESLDKNLYYRDTDGDGVSDYLEEKKFYTDHFKSRYR